LTKYLQRSGSAWTGSTTAGRAENPDVYDSARELGRSGFRQNVNAHKLLPLQFPDKGRTTFSDVFQAIAGNIEACRQEWKPKLGPEDPIAHALDEARTSMVGTHDARRADQAQYVIDSVNLKLSKNGYTWVCEQKKGSRPLLRLVNLTLKFSLLTIPSNECRLRIREPFKQKI
ncbi:hypothetical protein MMC25_004065, partial [Agyrium rufum]|nr:hypothetical protein [Agyrium rufum]